MDFFNHLRLVTAISAIVVCALFAFKLNCSSKVAQCFIKFGKSSLAIYLLSPFFIPCIPELGNYIILSDAFHPGHMPYAKHISSIFLQIISGCVVTFYVCFASLLLKSIIDRSDFFSIVLFGRKDKK